MQYKSHAPHSMQFALCMIRCALGVQFCSCSKVLFPSKSSHFWFSLFPPVLKFLLLVVNVCTEGCTSKSPPKLSIHPLYKSVTNLWSHHWTSDRLTFHSSFLEKCNRSETNLWSHDWKSDRLTQYSFFGEIQM